MNEDYVSEVGKDPYTLITRTGRDPYQQHHEIQRSSPLEHSHIGDLPAITVRTRYVENGTKYITEELAALSRDQGIAYTVTMDTTAEEFAKDQKVFRKLVAGFHTSPIDNSGRECSND